MNFSAAPGTRTALSLWIALAGVLLTALTGLLAGLFTPWLLVLAGVEITAAVFLALWYPPRYAAALHGSFDGTAIQAVKGVLWKKEVFVPLTALRTLEIWSTPIEQAARCRMLTLRFAGGAVVLPFLSRETAAQLAAQLEAAEQ